MSTRLAIIDLDGVVADATARFAKAELMKEQWLMERQQGLPYAIDMQTEKDATNLYWRTVFNPEHVPLDTPIPGVSEALLDIQAKGYKVIFLTSRPASMQDATQEWLFRHTVYDSDDELVMKAPAFQYVKTTVWKAGMVQTLVELYHASDVLIVEDEQINIDEHLKYVSTEVQMRRIYKSLAEAVEATKEEIPDETTSH